MKGARDDRDAQDAVDREWFGLLPDAERAEVLKVQITEREKTRRALADAGVQRHHQLVGNEGFYWVRGLALGVVLVAVMCATCVGYQYVNVALAPARPSPAPDAGAPPVEAGPDAGPR